MQLSDPTLFKTSSLINGAWVAANSAGTFEVTDPANGNLIGVVPDHGVAETKEAIAAASEAFKTWKKTTAKVSLVMRVVLRQRRLLEMLGGGGQLNLAPKETALPPSRSGQLYRVPAADLVRSASSRSAMMPYSASTSSCASTRPTLEPSSLSRTASRSPKQREKLPTLRPSSSGSQRRPSGTTGMSSLPLFPESGTSSSSSPSESLVSSPLVRPLLRVFRSAADGVFAQGTSLLP